MTEQTENQERSASLTLDDLTTTCNIIDLAVQRGAFKGAEAETVGIQFNRLVAIIRQLAPEVETRDDESVKEEAPASEGE
jgi:hypothetical protein